MKPMPAPAADRRRHCARSGPSPWRRWAGAALVAGLCASAPSARADFADAVGFTVSMSVPILLVQAGFTVYDFAAWDHPAREAGIAEMVLQLPPLIFHGIMLGVAVAPDKHKERAPCLIVLESVYLAMSAALFVHGAWAVSLPQPSVVPALMPAALQYGPPPAAPALVWQRRF